MNRARPSTLGFALVALAPFVTPPAVAQLWDVGQAAVAPPTSATSATAWGTAVASGDFDDDGFFDLVVGGPNWDITITDPDFLQAGAVSVYFGGPDGFGAPSVTFQGTDTNGHAGMAVAAGDFDHDGEDEVVFGEPGWSVLENEAGVVSVRYWTGSSWAIATSLRESDDTPGTHEAFDHFGASLAVGDFDGDTFDDLAIGIPDEDLEGETTLFDAGAVAVFYGTGSGLNVSGNQLFDQDDSGLGGGQAGAHFGFSLSVGDFDGDGYDDLAIGVPGRELSALSDAGQVVVLYGGSGGLSTSGAQVFDDTDMGGSLGTDDRFGHALAAGDFNRSLTCAILDSCRDELAVGIPGEPVSAQAHAGGVVIAASSSSGLVLGSGFTFWSQNALSNPVTSPEAGDRMGLALAAGEIDGRFGIDLLVGVPEEDWAGGVDRGIVHLFFGGPSGIGSYPEQTLAQQSWWGSGPGAAGDLFGSALAIGDFDDLGSADAAIGAPGRDWSAVGDSGVVQVLRSGLFSDSLDRGSSSGWSGVEP